MSRADIIMMAREAGFDVQCDGEIWEPSMFSQTPITDEIERFASLVAAAKQEECAKACEEMGPKEYPAKLVTDGFAAAIRALK